MAILDNSGNAVVKYKYDAYGNCSYIGSINADLAQSNPIRYRSYYYDDDTGLYYLNARYYKPEWYRFISPDVTEYLNSDNPNGLNLYAYCYNDPVNYADPSGHFVISTAALILIGVGVAAGLGYAAYTDYQDDSAINGSIGWQTYLGSAMIGGAIGFGIGYFWPNISSFLGSSFTFTLPSLGSLNTGGALALAGGTAITITGAQIVGGAAALGLGILLFARTSKSGGYYGEGWPGDPHKPEHIHLRGNGTDIRIGTDGKPLPNEPKLNAQQRKALERLWKEFQRMFNSWKTH